MPSANKRLLSIDGYNTFFLVKDYSIDGKYRLMTLAGTEFIRRWSTSFQKWIGLWPEGHSLLRISPANQFSEIAFREFNSVGRTYL